MQDSLDSPLSSWIKDSHAIDSLVSADRRRSVYAVHLPGCPSEALVRQNLAILGVESARTSDGIKKVSQKLVGSDEQMAHL